MVAAGVELPPEPGLPGSDDPYPPVLTISMEKVDTLRYGENPHQPAARYRRTDREPRAADGPFASGEPPLQGKALSYNNVLDASAAAALARLMRGPAIVICKHTNPWGAAERPSLLEAWEAALAGDPVSAFGGVVAVTGNRGPGAGRAAGVDLPRGRGRAGVRCGGAGGAGDQAQPAPGGGRLRWAPARSARPPIPLGSFRTAGGGVLVTSPDNLRDYPGDRMCTTSRRPTDAELRDMDLAWRLCRGVVSNAILLVRDGMLVGLGSGQVSRVDACRGAVDKARQFQGEDGATGAVAASDAFFPFADGPKVLLYAGVTAIVQPGGSMRDAEVLDLVERAGAAMLVTGKRHFPPLSAGPFPVDEGLLATAADRLRAHPGLRFVLGGAGTGKSSVCLRLRESIQVGVIDMDTRIYGTWGNRWDRTRHPASHAWMTAADPLALQLALGARGVPRVPCRRDGRGARPAGR